jgi:hypothetical protein
VEAVTTHPSTSRTQASARMNDVDSDSDGASEGEGMIVTFDSEVTVDDRVLISHLLDNTPEYGVVERNGYVTLPVRLLSNPAEAEGGLIVLASTAP